MCIEYDMDYKSVIIIVCFALNVSSVLMMISLVVRPVIDGRIGTGLLPEKNNLLTLLKFDLPVRLGTTTACKWVKEWRNRVETEERHRSWREWREWREYRGEDSSEIKILSFSGKTKRKLVASAWWKNLVACVSFSHSEQFPKTRDDDESRKLLIRAYENSKKMWFPRPSRSVKKYAGYQNHDNGE